MSANLVFSSTPILLVASAAVGVFVGSDLASAQGKRQLQCGDTVTRDTVLRRDLDCRGTGVRFGLRVRGPATLDLGGHFVNCDEEFDGTIVACVSLIGEGAGLESGSARSGIGPAVEVAGVGGHRVRDVDCFSSLDNGLEVVSDGNHLERNDGDADQNPFLVTGDANILDGNTGGISEGNASFVIEGADNLLTRNTALPRNAFGIVVEGPSNRLINNIVRQAGLDGIRLEQGAASTTLLGNAVVGAADVGIAVNSDRNLIVANEARDNEEEGVRLTAGAESNVVLGNQAGGNGGFDLFDGNPDCDANLWVANQFDDVNQACVALSLGAAP
jgi:parallel beta-helix repeat protein